MNKVNEILQKIDLLREELRTTQDECSHPQSCLKIKQGSNTGNYDPTADCYWTEYKND